MRKSHFLWKKIVKSTKQFSVKFLSNFCSFLICKMGKVLRESIATFYGLHHDKGKFYTFKNFKNAVPKNTIYQKSKRSQIWIPRPLSKCLKIWSQKLLKLLNLDWWVSLSYEYVICNIWTCILVRKSKCSTKYNLSTIFF